MLHWSCSRVGVGLCARRNEKKVYEKLCDLVEEWIEIYGEDNAPLPTATAGKQYSGKFNLRVGEELHERLVIESMNVLGQKDLR